MLQGRGDGVLEGSPLREASALSSGSGHKPERPSQVLSPPLQVGRPAAGRWRDLGSTGRRPGGAGVTLPHGLAPEVPGHARGPPPPRPQPRSLLIPEGKSDFSPRGDTDTRASQWGRRPARYPKSARDEFWFTVRLPQDPFSPSCHASGSHASCGHSASCSAFLSLATSWIRRLFWGPPPALHGQARLCGVPWLPCRPRACHFADASAANPRRTTEGGTQAIPPLSPVPSSPLSAARERLGGNVASWGHICGADLLASPSGHVGHRWACDMEPAQELARDRRGLARSPDRICSVSIVRWSASICWAPGLCQTTVPALGTQQ